jgi:hypothetical protein
MSRATALKPRPVQPVEEVGPTGAQARASRPVVTLDFLEGWRHLQQGELRQGGQLLLRFDEQRLPVCRASRNGLPSWGIAAAGLFHPGGETFRGVVYGTRLDGAGGPLPPEPRELAADVPPDAEWVELWFENSDARACHAWDSRYGQNYAFPVLPAGPERPVSFRTGAVRRKDAVNVFADVVVKGRHILGGGPPGSTSNTVQMRTRLSLSAWVRNLAYEKHVWVDLHVFDGSDRLVHSETLPLSYGGAAGGGGDFFSIDQTVFVGFTASPGSVVLRPDARKVQYRLYAEMTGQVFSDGVLHQYLLQEDAVTR